jgi:predicted nucleic acid-binding protein
MEQYLIDNNVISNYFSGQLPPKGLVFISEVVDAIPNISVITEIGALSWVSEDKTKEQIIREFISEANTISLTQAIVDQCIKIRRSRKIRTPDAIIAATAIVNDLVLITRDGDFSKIPDLHLVDPLAL